MSTSNIQSIRPDLPYGVYVDFRVHGGSGIRTYYYNSLEAARGIIAGDDPSQWSGIRVADGKTGSGVSNAAEGIGEAFGEAATDIAELI